MYHWEYLKRTLFLPAKTEKPPNSSYAPSCRNATAIAGPSFSAGFRAMPEPAMLAKELPLGFTRSLPKHLAESLITAFT